MNSVFTCILLKHHDEPIRVYDEWLIKSLKLDDYDTKFLHQFKNCQYSPNKKDIYKYDEQIVIKENVDTMFIKNEKLFNHNKWLILRKYDETKCEVQSEFVLDSLTINIKIKPSEWKANDDNNCGVIQIHCKNTLRINKDGSINAHKCGYYKGYGPGTAKKGCYSKGDGVGGCKKYGKHNLNVLYLGSGGDYDESRGGGIIEIIADTVIIHGTITSNGYYGGSGGCIKFVCNTFINDGIITANGGWSGYGRICIECINYRNEGTIYPIPYIMDNNKRKIIFTETYISSDDVIDVDDEKENDDDVKKQDIEQEIQATQDNIYHIVINKRFQYKLDAPNSLIINSKLTISPWNNKTNITVEFYRFTVIKRSQYYQMDILMLINVVIVKDMDQEEVKVMMVVVAMEQKEEQREMIKEVKSTVITRYS